MAASFVVNGGTVTIRFDWPDVPTDRAQEIVGYAARYDWLRGMGPQIEDPEDPEQTIQKPWADLTNQEKLTMVYEAAQRLIIAQAKTAYVNDAQNTARDTAAEYAEGKYTLD